MGRTSSDMSTEVLLARGHDSLRRRKCSVAGCSTHHHAVAPSPRPGVDMSFRSHTLDDVDLISTLSEHRHNAKFDEWLREWLSLVMIDVRTWLAAIFCPITNSIASASPPPP